MNNDKIKLVFATNNAHKLRELREILGVRDDPLGVCAAPRADEAQAQQDDFLFHF